MRMLGAHRDVGGGDAGGGDAILHRDGDERAAPGGAGCRGDGRHFGGERAGVVEGGRGGGRHGGEVRQRDKPADSGHVRTGELLRHRHLRLRKTGCTLM